MVGKSKKTILPVVIALVFYGATVVINKDLKTPRIQISKQESALNFDTNFLKLVSIGNKRFFADILWIQTLLESDEEHYKNNDLNSWMFMRFNNIAELDPKFYENYLWGGVYLSIIKDDRLGAAQIFEKGLIHFPSDFQLNYNAGFNYYAQLENYERAYVLFERIQNHPNAPNFLATLNAKIKFQTSFDFDGTIAFLIDQYNKSDDVFIKEKIKANLYALKAEKDLNCLNSQNKNCDKEDIEGNPYLKKNGKFTSPKPFTPYRVNRKG